MVKKMKRAKTLSLKQRYKNFADTLEKIVKEMEYCPAPLASCMDKIEKFIDDNDTESLKIEILEAENLVENFCRKTNKINKYRLKKSFSELKNVKLKSFSEDGGLESTLLEKLASARKISVSELVDELKDEGITVKNFSGIRGMMVNAIHKLANSLPISSPQDQYVLDRINELYDGSVSLPSIDSDDDYVEDDIIEDDIIEDDIVNVDDEYGEDYYFSKRKKRQMNKKLTKKNFSQEFKASSKESVVDLKESDIKHLLKETKVIEKMCKDPMAQNFARKIHKAMVKVANFSDDGGGIKLSVLAELIEVLQMALEMMESKDLDTSVLDADLSDEVAIIEDDIGDIEDEIEEIEEEVEEIEDIEEKTEEEPMSFSEYRKKKKQKNLSFSEYRKQKNLSFSEYRKLKKKKEETKKPMSFSEYRKKLQSRFKGERKPIVANPRNFSKGKDITKEYEQTILSLSKL